MAPPVADVIEAELAAGTLVVEEGHLLAVQAYGKDANLSYQAEGRIREILASRVINYTGPSMNYRRVKLPLLASLFAQGLVTPEPMGGGLDSTRFGALIVARGKVSDFLFNLGPGRLGTLLESVAIPEIWQQAVETAVILAGRVGRGQGFGTTPEFTGSALASQAPVAA